MSDYTVELKSKEKESLKIIKKRLKAARDKRAKERQAEVIINNFKLFI